MINYIMKLVAPIDEYDVRRFLRDLEMSILSPQASYKSFRGVTASNMISLVTVSNPLSSQRDTQ